MMDLAPLTNKDSGECIVVERHYTVEKEGLYQAFTDPEIIVRWFGRAPNFLVSADVDLNIGGRWRFIESLDDDRSIGFDGEYLKIVPNNLLVFTWSKFTLFTIGSHKRTPVSQVEVSFTAEGDGTLLRVVHSSIADVETRNSFSGGWNNALDSIGRLL